MPNTRSTNARRATSSAFAKSDSAAENPADETSAAAEKAAAEETSVDGEKAAGEEMPVDGEKAGAEQTPVAEKAVAKKRPAATKKRTNPKKASKTTAGQKTSTKKSVKKAAKRQSAEEPETVKKSPKRVTKTAVEKSAIEKKSVKKSATAKKTAKRSVKKAAAKGKPAAITKRVSRKRPAKRYPSTKPLIGWREWVVLPELTPTAIKAKVDSGEVTSALHAYDLELITDGDATIARFGVAPKEGSRAEKTTVERPVAGFKEVRSSNGQSELRPVIRTLAVIGEKQFEIDITLTSTDDMGFRMLLGRRAVRNRFVIDPGRSYLQPRSNDGQTADQ